MKRTEGLFWEKHEQKVEEGIYSLIVRSAATQHQPSSGGVPLLFEKHLEARRKCYFSLVSPEYVLPDFFPEKLKIVCLENQLHHDSGLEKLEEFTRGLSASEMGGALYVFSTLYASLGRRIAKATQLATFPVPSSWSQTFWSSFVASSFVSGVETLEAIVDELLLKEEGGVLFPNKLQQTMLATLELEVEFLRSFDSLLVPIDLVPTSHTSIELVVDFDGTITTDQTSPLLPLLSIQKRGKSKEEAEEEWGKLGESYMATYNEFLSTSLPSSSTIFEFLEKYDEFESTAYNPVEESQSLSHLTMEDIKACALIVHHNSSPNIQSAHPFPANKPFVSTTTSIRPGVQQGLRKMTEESTSLRIISLNWSQEFVSEVISLSFPASPLPSRVLSNSLFSEPPPHPSFPSTGKLTRRVTTSKEKVVFTSNPNSLKITIGDSLNDLSALLSSDIPIILKNHQTKRLSGSFSRVCESYGLSLLPLFASTFPSLSSPSPSPSREKNVIFVAESWWELCVWWKEWQKVSCQQT